MSFEIQRSQAMTKIALDTKDRTIKELQDELEALKIKYLKVSMAMKKANVPV